MKTKILDTFLIRDQQILYKDLHLQRVLETFQFFSINAEKKSLRSLYERLELESLKAEKIRIEFLVHKNLEYNIEHQTFQKAEEPVILRWAEQGRQKSGIGASNFKTTDRTYWEQNKYLSISAHQDVLGINDVGIVTETSRYNLFLLMGKNFYTPTLASGCLRGVFREYSLSKGFVELDGQQIPLSEQDFKPSQINQDVALFVGNSVQGLLRAKFSIELEDLSVKN